ncbi:gamma-butyrobetaine dioxygenase-like [Eriocheir sinensis]|uniref:gamma-butyrobetaine dioxygenase-like n=1 Tax=Eriocheir sinensis TaxID=95602 RepID=UPI0021C67EF7|nr:gamma-butyrobetaine dioxygenase-like [Eriocheir sinensis]
MSSSRYARVLLSGAAVIRNTARLQTRRQSHTCAHSRSLTLAAAARQQQAFEEAVHPGSGVMTATTGSDALHLQFLDGRTSAIPYSFLRDHCRCRRCRSLLTPSINSHFQPAVHPEIIQSNVLGVVIDWSDGHISKYSGEWLHNAAHDISFSLS